MGKELEEKDGLVPLIGNRIYWSKERHTFLVSRFHDSDDIVYQIHMDEFTQMVYIAMREGALQLSLTGADKYSKDEPFFLKLPKDKVYEDFLNNS